MRRLRLTSVTCLGLAVAGMTLALAGCYEESGGGPPAARSTPADAADQAPATQPADADSGQVRAYGNSQSTLGKAKDTAKGTIADLEARDREIQKQIDDQ